MTSRIAQLAENDRSVLSGAFLDVPPLASTFATPLFKRFGDNTKRTYVQEICGGGFIEGFAEVLYVDEECVVASSGVTATIQVGDAAVFSFFDHRSGGLVLGNRTTMSHYIERFLELGEDNAYTCAEALEFLGRRVEASQLVEQIDGAAYDGILEDFGRTATLSIWDRLALIGGDFIGQMTEAPIKSVEVKFEGVPARRSDRDLNGSLDFALWGITRVMNPDIALHEARKVAGARNIHSSFVKKEIHRAFDGNIEIAIDVPRGERSIVLTACADGAPRLLRIREIYLDARISPNMLYCRHEDVPGIFGLIGMTLGKNNVKVLQCYSGRKGPGQDAVSLLSIDGPFSPSVVDMLEGTGMFYSVRSLSFQV